MRILLLVAALAASTLSAPAQTLPRVLNPRVDHGVGKTYKTRPDGTLSKTSKMKRKKYRMTHPEKGKFLGLGRKK